MDASTDSEGQSSHNGTTMITFESPMPFFGNTQQGGPFLQESGYGNGNGSPAMMQTQSRPEQNPFIISFRRDQQQQQQFPRRTPILLSALPEATDSSGRSIYKRKASEEGDARKKRRRERNREAAARCRQKKIDQEKTLQSELDELLKEHSALAQELNSVLQAKQQLQNSLIQ